MAKLIAKKILTFVLLLSLFTPWATVLLSPEYAFAQGQTAPGTGSAPTNSAGGNQATRQGGTLSLSQAAASGVVSLGGCLAAAGLTIGAGLAYLGGLLGLTTVATGVTQTAGAAAAPLSVPVIDYQRVGADLGAAGQRLVMIQVESSLLTKETILDCIAWAIAKMVWKAIAASVINWINSGFNGNPMFIQNIGKFMTGIADQAIGSVLLSDPNLSFLCSPFSLNIKIALGLTFSRNQRAPACTFTAAMNNVKNFMGNFSNGGWAAWFDLTMVDANNPYGAYLLGQAHISLSIRSAQGQQYTYLNWGKGFFSKTEEVCNNGKCTTITVTPGELIAKQAGEQIGGGQTTLLMADELNEIISALVEALLNKALESFYGLSQGSGYSDSNYGSGTFTDQLGSYQGDATGLDTGFDASLLDGARRIANLVNQSIQAEQNLQLYNQDALSAIEQYQYDYDTLAQCWSSKITPNSGSYVQDPVLRAQASSSLQSAVAGKVALEMRKTPFAQRIAKTNTNITQLQSFIDRADTATTLAIQNAVLSEFSIASASGVYASPGDVSLAQAGVTTLRSELSLQNSSVQTQLQQCFEFPQTTTP